MAPKTETKWYRKYGAIIVGLLVVAAIGIYNIDNGNNLKATLEINSGNYAMRCNELREWLHLGELTSRLGGNITEAFGCADYFGTNWHIPAASTCETLHTWLLEESLTANLNGNIYTAELCSRNYPQIWQRQNVVNYEKCMELKSWLYGGVLTKNVGGNLAEASRCEVAFTKDWHTQPPDFNVCTRYKMWANNGVLTTMLGGNIAPAIACSQAYPKHWNGNPDYLQCETYKQWANNGVLTANLGGNISGAIVCSDQFPYLWHNNQGIPASRDFSRCMELRNYLFNGTLTSTIGSGTGYQEAVDCSDQYSQVWNQRPPKFERCVELKGYLNNGTLTPKLGGNIDEAINCSSSFGDYWHNNTAFSRCNDLKKWYDLGVLTKNLGGNIDEAVNCSNKYRYLWFANLSQGGSATSVPNSGFVPISGNVPVAGFENEVITNTTVDNAKPLVNPFNDVNQNNLEGIAAITLFDRGVVGGYPDGQFKGQKLVNRAEMSKFILLALGQNISDLSNNGKFLDVKDGEWYVKYVITAANKGIVNGYADKTFKPAQNINTAEFLKMITFAFNLEKNMAYGYGDVNAGDWYAQYAGVAQKYNLFPGRSSNLEPAREITRYEAVVAIYKLIK